LAASKSCHVVSIEPQKILTQASFLSSQYNQNSDLITIASHYADEEGGNTNELFSQGLGAFLDHGVTDGRSRETVKTSITSIRADDLIGNKRVRIAKIIVEGYEWHTIMSMRNTLSRKGIDHVVMRFVPAFIGKENALEIGRRMMEWGYALKLWSGERIGTEGWEGFVLRLLECPQEVAPCGEGAIFFYLEEDANEDERECYPLCKKDDEFSWLLKM